MSETVEYTSLGGRLMESIKGVLFGIVLFLASFVVLFWNEGRAVRTARGLAEGQKVCVELSPDRVDPAGNGRLGHLTGRAVTPAVLRDAQFGVAVNALRLDRGVAMYQWIEHKETKTEKQLGGGEKKVTTYTYSKGWDDTWHDPSTFHDAQTPANPVMTVRADSWLAQPVTVGAFTLPGGMVAALDADEALRAGGPEMPAGGKHKDFNGEYYLGANPAEPQIGDLRVSFRLRRPGDVSLLARVNGSTFEPYVTQQGTTISVIRPGVLSAALMFQQEVAANTTLTWILRLAGFLVMTMGLGLVLKPISTLGDVVPLVGSLLGAGIGVFSLLVSLALSLVTIGIAWVVYRPVLGIVLLVGALAALALLGLRSRKTPARPAT